MKMSRFLLPLLAAPILLGLAAPVSAQLVNAYHDQTGAQHQAQFNVLSQAGYRMISLSIYGDVNSPRYAAVWVQRSGPTWVGFHGLNGTDYQNFVNTYWGLGFRPTILSATGSASNPRFAGVMEAGVGPGGWASHGITESQFWDQRSQAQDQGLDVRAVDIYGTNADPRYVVSFGPTDYGQAEVVSVGVQGYQNHFDALGEGHARPSFVGFNDDHRYISLWRSDDVGPWVAHHDMTSTEYQNYTNLYWPARFPITVQGSGSGSNTRFAAVWAPNNLPAPKVWTKTGQNFGQFFAFDNWVQNWMTDSDTRAAQLAIVWDHRLVYARGYTLARSGYPITQPTDIFKIASCSKPITGIAMQQHFEADNGMDRTDDMMDYFPQINGLDPQLSQITLNSLLTHQGGWNRNVSPDPMVGFDTTIAAWAGTPLPITKQQITNYMLSSQSLDFTPNTASRYSNFGFSLLGQVLEAANPGLSYAQVVDRDIFQPLGLTRPRIANSSFAGLHPGEVTYHPYTPNLTTSVMDDAEPWVARQYGGLNHGNMDSHGAWVMSAPDYAKILAAFDLGASNPLMTPASAQDMFTVEPGYSTLMRGWYKVDVNDQFGSSVEMYHHNGLLSGARSFIARRADGLSFVFLTNGDKNSMGGDAQGVELNDIWNQTMSAPPLHDLFDNLGIPSFNPTPGDTTFYGASCYGSWGFPVLQVNGSLDVGSTIDFDFSNVAPNRSLVLALGLGPTSISLSPFGATNCYLWTNPVATLPGISNAFGNEQISWMAPPNADAIGLSVYTQGLIIDPPANSFGIVTTAGIEVEFGGWQ